VATEFDWYGDADVDIATLRAFVVAAIGGRQYLDGTVHRDGMYVMPTVGSEDDDEVIPLFGFEERLSATFRFANLADATTTEHNMALMVHLIIAFAQSHGGSGVLLYNGERAVLQYGKDGVVFDSDWADWTDNPEVAPLLGQFTSRQLVQPLL
jgi:hypothetical protein